MKLKKLGAVLMAAAITVSLAACGAPDAKSADKKGAFPGTADMDMVTLNVTTEPAELNSMRLQETVSQTVLAHCMAGLTRLNENDDAVADLADSWEISEDNTTYTMHLKKDAKWSNGDAVTANDYYFSWVSQMIPETGTIFADQLYMNIKNGEAFYNGECAEEDLGLKVLDDYTLEIVWSHPMPEANGLFFLSQPFYLPVNQKAYEEIGEQQYAKEADKIVTNGAYTISEWVHDDHLTLTKSEDYYDSAEIKIPKLKLVMIGDNNTSLNAFTAGELDLCSLYSEQIKQVKDKSEKAVGSYIDGGSWYLSFNLKDPYFSNENLRKAMAYSIDVQSLLDHVINDGSVAADGLVPGTIAGVGDKTYAEVRGNIFGFDKEAANEYLNKALQELGVTKENLKLALWDTNTEYSKSQSAYLQQQWKENLGLDVEVKSMAYKALSEAKQNGEYSFTVDAWGPSQNDAITYLENFQSANMNNNGKYASQEYDRLVGDAIQEGDADKRQEMMIQAEKMLVDEMVIGPMYFTCTTYAVSDKLDGLVRTPFQYFNVRNASIVTK